MFEVNGRIHCTSTVSLGGVTVLRWGTLHTCQCVECPRYNFPFQLACLVTLIVRVCQCHPISFGSPSWWCPTHCSGLFIPKMFLLHLWLNMFSFRCSSKEFSTQGRTKGSISHLHHALFSTSNKMSMNTDFREDQMQGHSGNSDFRTYIYVWFLRKKLHIQIREVQASTTTIVPSIHANFCLMTLHLFLQPHTPPLNAPCQIKLSARYLLRNLLLKNARWAKLFPKVLTLTSIPGAHVFVQIHLQFHLETDSSTVFHLAIRWEASVYVEQCGFMQHPCLEPFTH